MPFFWYIVSSRNCGSENLSHRCEYIALVIIPSEVKVVSLFNNFQLFGRQVHPIFASPLDDCAIGWHRKLCRWPRHDLQGCSWIQYRAGGQYKLK